MMLSNRFWVLHLLVIAGASVLLSPLTLSAQEGDEKDNAQLEKASRRAQRGQRRRDPDRIRERLEQLRSEDPDNPKIEKLEAILDRMEQRRGEDAGRGERRQRGRFGKGKPDGPPPCTDEEIQRFLSEHEELERLLLAGPEGKKRGPKQADRRMRRHRDQLCKMLRAFEEGDEEFGQLLIESAKVQFRVNEVLRGFRQAAEGSGERQAFRSELEGLTRQQVQFNLQIREKELGQLRDRLASQEKKLAKDWDRQQEIAAKKLERMLSRKPKEKRKHQRSGKPKKPKKQRFGPDDAPDAPRGPKDDDDR